MRKISINSILILTSLILTTVLMCTWYDEYTKNNLYNSNYNYRNNDFIWIPSKANITPEKMNSIVSLAKDNSVLLEKNTIETNHNIKSTVHYVTFDNIETLSDFFHIHSDISGKKGISTYFINDDFISIKDFLNNDFHVFMLFDEYDSNNTNFTGEYKIFYNDKENYDDFITELSAYLDLSKPDLNSSTFLKTTSNFDTIKSIYMICMIMILISIFVTNLFSAFKKSNEIGIYKLNGFSYWKILKYLVSKEFRNCLLVSIVIFVISCVMIKNCDIYFALLLLFTYMIIQLLQLLISAFSIVLILKTMKLSNLIKKEKMTTGVMKFNSFFKIVTLGLMLVLTSIVITQLINFNNRKNDLKIFEEYSDYSVFARFYEGEDFNDIAGDSELLDEAELSLYKYLTNYDIVYADFKTYSIASREEENFYNTPTREGNKKYKYGTIDYNYLDDLNLIDSATNQKIEISKMYNSNVFLIPKSLSGEVENFKKFYYEYYNQKENDLFIVYNDTQIPSLSPEIASDNHYLISSPIMRVITPNNISVREVNVFGSGYDTALKIKTGTKEEKTEFYNKIYPTLVELNLDDNINSDVFYTYDELFEVELNEVKQQIATFSILLVLLLICFIYIIVQANLLYIRNEYKTIAIKKLNGFSNAKVFGNKILNSLIISVVIMLVVIIFFHKYFNWIYILISGVISLIMELILSLIIIKITANKYIAEIIKGGEL